MASATDTEADNLPWYRSRRDLGIAALSLLMLGAAMHLGGAGMYSVAVWSTVAVISLGIVGFSPSVHRRDWLMWGAIVYIAVTALQLVPLPPALLRAIDSQSAEWSARAQMPFLVDRSAQWRPLHVDPGNGYSELQYAIGLLAAYFAAARVARRGRGEDIVVAATVIPSIMAAVGFGHKLANVDKIFGVYTPFDTSPPELTTPIVNQNHLSNYLGIGAVVAAGLAANASKIPRKLAFALLAVGCAAGSTLSFSRAGIASTAGGLVMLASWLSWRSKPRRKGVSKKSHARTAMVTAAIVGAAIVPIVFFSWDLLHQDSVRNDTTKLTYIRAALRVALAHPLIGVGSGACYSVLTADGRETGTFTAERAESLPVDMALAIGPLLGAIVCAMAVRGIWMIRPARKGEAWVVGAYSAVLAAVVHDLLDFSLWLGATGYLTAILAGALRGESSRHDTEQQSPLQQSALTRVVIAAIAALIAFTGVRTSQWSSFVDRARIQSMVQRNEPAFERLQAAMARHPADGFLSILGARHAQQRNDRRIARFLNQAMWLAPRWPAPHELIAVLLARQGRREQALIEIRLAIEHAESTPSSAVRLLVAMQVSREEMARAIPRTPNGDALLRALSQTPLGELADSMILERSPNDPDTLLRVAQRVERTPSGLTRAKELYEQVLRAHPDNVGAARQLGMLLINENQLDHAETVVQQAINRTHAPSLFETIARVHAARGHSEPMRRAMQQWIEAVGGDFDERARILGILGEFELGLRNYGAAYTAFEQGDLAAGETHPYLARIVEVARRSGDLPRWRGACTRLRELTATDDPRRSACDTPPTASAPE
ncbi:MAG: tetratricopeptide repeat protein [Polyangiales bacterium]